MRCNRKIVPYFNEIDDPMLRCNMAKGGVTRASGDGAMRQRESQAM